MTSHILAAQEFRHAIQEARATGARHERDRIAAFLRLKADAEAAEFRRLECDPHRNPAQDAYAQRFAQRANDLRTYADDVEALADA